MTTTEDRLRNLRTATRGKIEPSPQLLTRIRQASVPRPQPTPRPKLWAPAIWAVAGIATAVLVFSAVPTGTQTSHPSKAAIDQCAHQTTANERRLCSVERA